MNMEWMKVTDRLPTKEDADKHGEVLGYYPGSGAFVTRWNFLRTDKDCTYWARIDPPK